ncbi:MAG TPA: hypothetical protein VJJ02_00040 [Candidatus Paceibacterota bacterium]
MINRVLMFGLVTVAAFLTPLSFADAAKRIPHYFPEGLETTTDPVGQWSLVLETFKATSRCQKPDATAWPVLSVGTIKETRDINDKKVTFHFDPWTRERDGKIYYTDFCGRKRVTEAEFAIARESLIAHYVAGVKGAYEYHKNLESDIVKAIAGSEKITETNVRANLAKFVPELAHLSPPATFREFLRIPPAPFSENDFVQKEVHFVHALYQGMVIIDTELIFLTLEGQVLDHLTGKPSIAIHELTHGNQKLQSLLDGLEHEYLASIPMLLIPEDQFWFMFHPYVADMREMAWVLFGFDFVQARREIFVFPNDGLNIRINPVKLAENVRKLDAIKAAFSKHYREVALPEIYRRRLFWASLNNKLQDNHGVFRVLVMMDFDPTILNGHASTMEFLQTNEALILSMAEKAFKESGIVGSSGPTALRKYSESDISTLRLLMRVTGMNEEALRRLAAKYHLDVTVLSNVSPREAFNIILPILRAEHNGRLPFEQENVK